jgi:hypothetical protein
MRILRTISASDLQRHRHDDRSSPSVGEASAPRSIYNHVNSFGSTAQPILVNDDGPRSPRRRALRKWRFPRSPARQARPKWFSERSGAHHRVCGCSGELILPCNALFAPRIASCDRRRSGPPSREAGMGVRGQVSDPLAPRSGERVRVRGRANRFLAPPARTLRWCVRRGLIRA